MIYVMSDLHGCYDEYMQMLEKINLKKDDLLYILGDVIDRGDNGIKILLDMMHRENVIPILGNHEYMAYTVLKKFSVEITSENYDKHLQFEDMRAYENWIFNGGISTIQEYQTLTYDVKQDILKYIEEFDLYEELEVSGRKFVLVHGGLVNFDVDKSLDKYDIHDLIWGRCDYAREYYPDKFLVTGHTPTQHIDSDYKGKIYCKNNHIAIDCGAVFGLELGCICLDTMEEFYV